MCVVWKSQRFLFREDAIQYFEKDESPATVASRWRESLLSNSIPVYAAETIKDAAVSVEEGGKGMEELCSQGCPCFYL